MNNFFAYLTAFFAITLISGSASAGTIQIENNTGGDIQVSCSHAKSFEVHNGQSRSVSYKHSVQNVNCSAKDHDGHHIEDRSFHFESHDDRRDWHVGRH